MKEAIFPRFALILEVYSFPSFPLHSTKSTRRPRSTIAPLLMILGQPVDLFYAQVDPLLYVVFHLFNLTSWTQFTHVIFSYKFGTVLRHPYHIHASLMIIFDCCITQFLLYCMLCNNQKWILFILYCKSIDTKLKAWTKYFWLKFVLFSIVKVFICLNIVFILETRVINNLMHG